MNNTEQVAFGQYGSKSVSHQAVSADEGSVFVAITALTNATLSGDADSAVDSGFSCPNDIAIPAGVTVYGRWTSLKTSAEVGKLIAYQGK